MAKDPDSQSPIPIGYIVTPFLFFPIGLFQAFHFFKMNLSEQALMAFFVQIFLLDIVHNAFTFCMLLLPAFRGLMQPDLRQRGGLQHFWPMSGGVFLSAFLVFLLAYGALTFAGNRAFWFILGPGIIFQFVSSQHVISQSKGMSLLINRWMIGESGADDKEKIRRLEFFERIAALGLILFFGMFRIVHASSLVQNRHWPLLHYGLFGSVVFFTALWCWAASAYPKIARAKLFYASRMFLYPLACFSPLAGAGIKFAHGSEYLFLYNRMRKTSGAFPGRRQVWAISVAIVAVISLLCIPRATLALMLFLGEKNFNAGDFRIQHPAIAALGALSIAFTFVHYYMDSRLFRMRAEPIREAVGGLLLVPERK